MSNTQTDSFFCIRIKRISHLQQHTFLSSESYVRVHFGNKRMKRKTSYGIIRGSSSYHWNETLSFPVLRDTISTETASVEFKHRLRFGQSSVIGSVQLQLINLRGYVGIKDSAILKDKSGHEVGAIHYEISLRPDTVSSLASYPSINSQQNSIPDSVYGSIQGSVTGSIHGSVHGSVQGSVQETSQGGYLKGITKQTSVNSAQSVQSQSSSGVSNSRVYGQQQISYLRPNLSSSGGGGEVPRFIPARRINNSTAAFANSQTSGSAAQ
eukprot:g2239.t1